MNKDTQDIIRAAIHESTIHIHTALDRVRNADGDVARIVDNIDGELSLSGELVDMLVRR